MTQDEKNEKVASKRTKCEVYSRIVGYIRPVQNWNPGKSAEFHDRKGYNKVLQTNCSCD